MARLFVFLAALLALAPLAAVAQLRLADDDPAAKDVPVSAPAKSAGTLDGEVVAVDYRASTMALSSGSRRVEVTILPSTNIAGPNNSFRTIADIHKGSHVRVLLSQRAGTYTAQIITLH